jgi:hypothetical protein
MTENEPTRMNDSTRMDGQEAALTTNFFMPHPNFCDEVNRNIIQSEIEGGVYLDNLSEGVVLEIETQHHWYTIVTCARGQALIWGHPKFCPEPVPVRIEGSTWGGSMLKVRFIGRGMHLEFRHPTYRRIVTSRIVDIRARGQLSNPSDPYSSDRVTETVEESLPRECSSPSATSLPKHSHSPKR